MNGLSEMILSSGHSLSVFALNTKKHRVEAAALPERLLQAMNLREVKIDTSLRFFDGLLNVFRPDDSYNVVRFHDDHAEAELISLIKSSDFDVVVLESLFTTPYLQAIRQHSNAKIILRAHNVEHVIWNRLADRTANSLRRSYIRFLSRRLKRYEDRITGLLDGYLPISDIDAAYFKKSTPEKPLLTMPLCIDTEQYPFQETTGEPIRLFHLGSMDWMPNVEAIAWFLETCWEDIHVRYPALELHLAGRSYPEHLLRSEGEGVYCSGTVADAKDYMRDKQVMIVPLLSGSGIRIKILQGMAYGKTIISTRIGCEGLPVTDGKDILLAETPEQFLEQTSRCMNDPAYARQIGRNARELIEKHFSIQEGARQLDRFLERLIREDQ